jgi:hypothetical protein
MLFGAMSRTINQILFHRSSEKPDEIVCRFLSDDGVECAEITCSDLDQSARRAGAWIAVTRGRRWANVRAKRIAALGPSGFVDVGALPGRFPARMIERGAEALVS